MAPNNVIVSLDHVGKSFPKPEGGTLAVFEDITLDIRGGEFVVLVGRSGCGKSTVLRIIAGLIAQSSGTVRYHGAQLTGINPGAAMVFQNFALMPWLNVEKTSSWAWLHAKSRPPNVRPARSRRSI